MRLQSYGLYVLILFISAERDPFLFKKKPIVQTWTLKGTVVGDCSFAYILHDNEDFSVGVGEAIGEWVVIAISSEEAVLKNKAGKRQVLKIYEPMKMGE